MISVTERASELLDAIDRPTGTVLRLEPTEGAQGVALTIGLPRPDDMVVERDTNDILHVSAAISDLLDGLTIDRVETPDGPSLSVGRADA